MNSLKYLFLLIMTISCKEKADSVANTKVLKKSHLLKRNDPYVIFYESDSCLGKVKDTVIVLFESNFNNSLLELTLNDTIIQEYLETDNSLGYSKYFELGERKNIDNFQFRINGGSLVTFDSIRCNYVFVNYSENKKMTVSFANKMLPYQ